MPTRVGLIAVLAALSLAACSSGPLRDEVVAQARPGGQVAFDVVKLDDAVLHTVLARGQPGFAARFKSYVPPPELKIAVGDRLSVVIWEATSDGLFGNSLTELSFPAGAATAAEIAPHPSLPGVSAIPGGLVASPSETERLSGGAAAATGNTGNAATEAQSASPLRPAPADEAEAGARQPRGLESPRTSADGPPGRGRKSSTEGKIPVEQLIDAAEQSGRAGTRIPDQPVGPDGKISIPYGGRVAAAGRTPSEVARAIEHRLADKALDPQALVVVKESAANAVSVTGEIATGRRVPLSPGGDRLLQVIAAAGGAHAPVHDTFVRLSRGGKTATVPLATLVADPAEDIFARPGDVLTLVKRPQTFSVFGAVGRNAAGGNAAITITRDHMSLAEAVAKAGGLLDFRADARAVFLFRYEPESLVRALGQPIASTAHDGVSPIVYRLDLMDPKSYHLAQSFPIRDRDIIFVSDAAAHPLYQFFGTLSQLTGPVVSGFVTCQAAHC